jgi:hypothetical protein
MIDGTVARGQNPVCTCQTEPCHVSVGQEIGYATDMFLATRGGQTTRNEASSGLGLGAGGHGIPLALDDKLGHEAGGEDLTPEALLLQQLECAEGWPGMAEELCIAGVAEVLQVGEVGDKLGLLKQLLGGQKIKIDGIGKALDKLGVC